MKLKIKICGMRESNNIKEVASLYPDFMGFIYYEKSPRYVGNDFIAPSIDASISRVGVFVNHDFDFMMQQAKFNSLSYIQLHGDESPELCQQLKSVGLSIIKAFHVDSDFDFEPLGPYKTCCDYFLFDTKGSNFGGTGKTFDWSMLNRYTDNIPFFLSGGLNPDNVDQIKSILNSSLVAVDLNSGVEANPGKKDISKLKKVFSQLNRN